MSGAGVKYESVAAALVLALVLDTGDSVAQSGEEEVMEENVVESVLTNSDDVADILTPIDINEATLEDLLSIAGIDETSAASIIAYRERNIFIRSLEEISNIDGITPAQMSALMRRTRILENNRLSAEMTSYAAFSPQRSSLYEGAYGDYGLSNFQRVEFSYRNFEGCAVTDKDPGESNYADFYSFALAGQNVWLFSAVNVGNYALSLGNGLLFSSGGMISKSAGAITPLFTTRAYSLRPYRSKGESKFLRGAAFAVPVGGFEFTVFTSMKDLTARIDSAGCVTSIDYSGLTLSSSASRGKLRETIAGGVVRYDAPALTGGFSAIHFSYDHPFMSYYGKQILALESFARLHVGRLAFSGEILFDRSTSFTSNVSLDYDDARFAIGARILRSQIVQNYSGPMSESFPTNPEEGIYFGASLRPIDFVKLGFYYDRFRIISISGEPDRSGEEIFVDSYISLTRERIFEGTGTLLYLRYKYKTKEDPFIPFTDFPVALSVIAGSKQSFRIDFVHKFGALFSIRARTERVFISSGEKGGMFQFGCRWNFMKGSVESRLCFYRTDSYKSAFYTVESDLPYVMGSTFLYGDGGRLFIIGNWKLTRSFAVGIKVGRDIYYGNREISVGSASKSLPGLSEISAEVGYTIN